MKYSIVFTLALLLLGSCAILGPRAEFTRGMSEKKFLRQNRDAVISTLDGEFITYRVNRGETFYVLATFEEGKLVKLEERELVPAWMPQQPTNENNNEE
ncbi:hypothetical protein ACFSKL_21420 [Belliella marina]|uniref:Uncharacterized protein n=1 Tax=Belliella marina TaxID=1644146 RepID=A0ABW4VSV5_9BACT